MCRGGGVGPPPCCQPCCWGPLDSVHPTGSAPENTEQGGIRETALGVPAGPPLTLGPSFLFYPLFYPVFCPLFLKLCAASGPVRDAGGGEEKVLIKDTAVCQRQQQSQRLPQFPDQAGPPASPDPRLPWSGGRVTCGCCEPEGFPLCLPPSLWRE